MYIIYVMFIKLVMQFDLEYYPTPLPPSYFYHTLKGFLGSNLPHIKANLIRI